MSPIHVLIFFFLTHSLLPTSAEEKAHPRKCPPFSCGKFGLIQFPFNSKNSPACGVFTVDCSENKTKIQLKEGGHWYGVKSISQADAIVIKETIPLPDCKSFDKFSLPSPKSSLFQFYNLTVKNSSTLYNCSHSLGLTPSKDLYQTKCGAYDFYTNPRNISVPFEQQCQNFTLPFPLQQPTTQTKLSIDFTFQAQISPACWGCFLSGEKCHNTNENQFKCLNALRPFPEGHSEELRHFSGHEKKKAKLGLGVGGALGGIGIMVVVVLIIHRLRTKHNPSYENVDAFLKEYGAIQNKRYSYKSIKKMTNSFAEKLGQGSFGDVYKGKLEDGSFVAVKVLNQSKSKDGQDFINEVATISRTSHVNVVTLLGFCFDGPKKALIYEFMPNGSLEKFIFEDNATNESSHHLDWETSYQISLGIAKGLEYLHRGCKTRILHFDIKPHNILLDVSFVPKISDFGLAKICKREESVVSMLGPRGTPGYIAPEVFNRSFGSVSHKSDVYSYGMMVLEIIGGRRNINIQADKTSEIYFPHWIYKRLEIDEDLGLNRILNEEDGVKVKKMIMVSLWCIQTNPSNRPTMSRVIEMLEGSMDSLEVPPKPFLYSPSRSPPRESSQTFV